MENNLQLTVQIAPTDQLDPYKIEKITSTLQTELREIDYVESVKPARTSDVPPDTLAGEALTLGTLLVTFAASGGVFTTLIETLKARLSRSNVVEVTLNGNTIKVSDLNSETSKLLEQFMNSAVEDSRQNAHE